MECLLVAAAVDLLPPCHDVSPEHLSGVDEGRFAGLEGDEGLRLRQERHGVGDRGMGLRQVGAVQLQELVKAILCRVHSVGAKVDESEEPHDLGPLRHQPDAVKPLDASLEERLSLGELVQVVMETRNLSSQNQCYERESRDLV